MKPTFLIFLFSFISSFSFGQGEANIWYFGDSIGLNFNYNPPKKLYNSNLIAFENVTAVSDRYGQLLFYTDGETIYNKNNEIMYSTLKGNWSCHNGSLIVQSLSDTNIYYLFTTDEHKTMNESGFGYTTIDMRLNNGLGGVSGAYKQLLNTSAEMVSGVRHNNNRDIWIVTKDPGSPKYYSFLVSPTGVSITPIISTVGTVGELGQLGPGVLKFSSDGSFAVVTQSRSCDYLSFDKTTGKFLSAKTLVDGVNEKGMNLEVSANSRFLYVNICDGNNLNICNIDLYQYDLKFPTLSQIKGSRVKIWGNDVGMLQIAPNGKIYVSPSNSSAFGVINEPDLLGDACDFNAFGVVFDGVTSNYSSLPNVFRSYLYLPDLTFRDTCLGVATQFGFSFNEVRLADSVFWDFGDTSQPLTDTSSLIAPSYKYPNPGRYTVTLDYWRDTSHFIMVRSISITDDFVEVSLGNDTLLCEGEELILYKPEYLPNKYNWSNGKTSTLIQIQDSGYYWLDITNAKGCISRDSIHVAVNENFTFDKLPSDTFSCESDTLLVNIGSGAETYTWSHGNYDSIASFSQTGTYYVQAANGSCVSEDSIHIDFYPKPLFSLGDDTTICNTDSITLNGTSNVKYQWNVGDTTQSITIKPTGTYILTQNTQYCEWKDTIQIRVQQQPSLNIGNDTVVCIGAKVIIGNTIPNGIQYTWNNRGDATPKITTDSQAVYSVIAYDGVCRAYDTIFVGVYTPQGIELGTDSTLCVGTETELDATINRGKYIWNDGLQTPTRMITQPGNYSVQITDSVCQYSDAITINFSPVPPLELGPDTALCQEEIYELTVDNSWEKITWSDGSNQYSRIFITEGTYTVTGSYLNCQETDSINVNYHPPLPNLNLGADQDVCDPLFYPLQVAYNGYYGTVWQDGTRGNYYEVSKTGDYIISTQPHRCGQVSDTIHITFLRELCDLHIPNVFTPNADGENDTFFPVGYQMEVENMKIYSRWGELLYDGDQPWDGTYQGAMLPNGSYLYVIIYKKEYRGGKKTKFIKGTVQILR